MTERIAVASPRFKARIAGVFYLLNILTGALALVFVGRKLVGYGDAALLIAAACYTGVTLLFYGLFKPVNRRLSLLAAFFSLVGCAISALSPFHLPSPHISPLVFFGFYCLLIGYLIFRSTFLPRVLGALMAFGGLGWLTFLSPPLASMEERVRLLGGTFSSRPQVAKGTQVAPVWDPACGKHIPCIARNTRDLSESRGGK